MHFRLILYAAFSNLSLLCCWFDCLSTHSDFFSRMNALSNSTLCILLAYNALIANIFLLSLLVTMIFFGNLTAQDMGFAGPFFLRLLFDIVPPLLALNLFERVEFNFLMGVLGYFVFHMWISIYERRADALMGIESKVARFWNVCRLTVFIIGLCEVVTLAISMLWNAQSSEKSFFHSDNTLNVFLFLYYSLIFLCCLQHSLCLAVQEWCRVFVCHGFRERKLVVAKRIFLFLRSVAFACLTLYAVYYCNQVFVLVYRPLFSNVSDVYHIPYHMLRYYRVSQRLKSVPPVPKEELEKEEIICTICYAPIKNPKGTRRLPCLHAFHESCLRQWFEEHTTCPYCRHDLLQPVIAKREISQSLQQQVVTPAHGAMENQIGGVVDELDALPEMTGAGLDIHNEIQRAYVEYLRGANLSYITENTEMGSSADASGFSSLSGAPKSPTEIMRQNQQEEKTEKGISVNDAHQRETSTSPIRRIGKHVGTLRFIPSEKYSIKDIIEHEKSVEKQEFGRAAAAIAVAENAKNEVPFDELNASSSTQGGSASIAHQREPEGPHEARDSLLSHPCTVHEDVKRSRGSPTPAIFNFSCVSQEGGRETEDTSECSDYKRQEAVPDRGLCISNETGNSDGNSISRLSLPIHRLEEIRTYIMSDDIPENLEGEMDEALRHFESSLDAAERMLKLSLRNIRARAKESEDENMRLS